MTNVAFLISGVKSVLPQDQNMHRVKVADEERKLRKVKNLTPNINRFENWLYF